LIHEISIVEKVPHPLPM